MHFAVTGTMQYGRQYSAAVLTSVMLGNDIQSFCTARLIGSGEICLVISVIVDL